MPNGCLRAIFAEAAAAGEVPGTLADLQSLVRDGTFDDCHLEAHGLARAAYDVLRDVRSVFLLGGPQCRLGYFHGAVEASASTPESGPRNVHGLELPPCGRLRGPGRREACSHGFGHALMLRTGHRVAASVRSCRAAERVGVDREACELGVMMQNSARHVGQPPERFRRHAARGCKDVAASLRLERLCYDNVGLVAALYLDHDRRRASAVCRGLTVDAQRDACLDGAEAEIAEASRERGG